MDFDDTVKLFVGTIFALAFVGVIFAIFGININMDVIINWFIPIGVSFILSALVGKMIESVTGDFFKDIYLSFDVPFTDFRVNIPLFVILVIVTKLWIFG